jgi:hypothetical protein
LYRSSSFDFLKILKRRLKADNQAQQVLYYDDCFAGEIYLYQKQHYKVLKFKQHGEVLDTLFEKVWQR